MMENEKKVKYKIKPVPVAIASTLIVAVIVITAALASNLSGNKEPNPTVDIKPAGSEAQSVTEEERIKVTVKIDMDDCILTTDQVLQVTATVEPADTDTAVIWKCSDESVMEVDNDGVIRAKKTGVSALTATVGNVTDAIVVRWVSPENGTSSIPGGNTKPTEGNSQGGNTRPTQGNSQGGNTSPTQGNSQGGNTKPTEGNSQGGNTKPTEGNSQGGNTSPTQGNSQGGNTKPTEGNSQGGNTKPTEGNSQGGNTKPTEGNTQGGNTKPTEPQPAEAMKSTDLFNELEPIGFVRHIANVYKYESNGKYCGQVLIESNVAIIYLKERNADFENAVLQVLTLLLPGRAQDVWKTYVGSGSDSTFMVGDRKVRIVVGKNGGHSQIVVYN